MPTNNVQFKRGTMAAFASLATKDSNTIYFITDTNRLFVGDSEYTRPVQHGSKLPTSKNPANSLFVKGIGTSRELYYSKDGITWDMITYLPVTITGGVFGDNTAGTVAYGGTVNIPKVTVDNRGYVTAAKDVTITLPTSDKVTTVTTSGDGNAVTGGSISNDGATLTLTKGESFVPASGGTFTGDVIVNGDLKTGGITPINNNTIEIQTVVADNNDPNPMEYYARLHFKDNFNALADAYIEGKYDIDKGTGGRFSEITLDAYNIILDGQNVSCTSNPSEKNHLTNKSYVDNAIASALSASDAMVLKGTLGAKGTAITFADIDLSTAVKGDTYKVITADTLPAANSSDSTAHILTPGDLIVYMGESKFIYVPSGDEDVTSIKVAGSGDTINVSTTAQTGNLVLGTAAAANTASTVTNDSTTVPTTAAVKTYVDSAESLAMPKTGGTFTGDVTMNADFTAQDEIRIASTDTQENLVNHQQHSDTKLIFDNANPVSGAVPMSIEGYYNAAVYSTHAYDDSTIKINATNFEAGGLTATEAAGTSYGTGSDITTGMVFLNTNEIDLTATRRTASDAIGIIGEVHDKTNLTFANTGWYSDTNETKSYIEGYYSFKEYDDEDNTNNVDTAHLDLIADEIKLDGDVKVTNALTTRTLTINSEDSTNITTSNQIHDISTLTFANNNQVNDNDKLATIVAQYSANVIGGGTHVEDWSTLKLQADTIQLADLAIGGVDIGSAQTVTLTPQHDIPIDRVQKVDSESIVMRYNVAQHEGQKDSTDILLNASNIITQGPITLPNNPTQANHAANKAYVDTALSNITDTKVTTVTATGDGNAVTAGSISADGTTLMLTKDANFVPATGGTFSGDVTIEGTLDVNNINNLIVEKREAYENYIAIRGTRLSSIIPTNNNNLYASPTIDITWNQGGGAKLSLNAAGDTGHIELNAGSGVSVNAPLYLSRTPEGAREATTKEYVDNAVSAAALTWGTI